MRNSEFKKFRDIAVKNGVDFTGHMMYAWIDLTEKQINTMCDIARDQGMTTDGEGWYTLANGLRFKKL